MTLDFGYADLENHTLHVCLDCGGDVAEIGFPFEATYANNQETNNMLDPVTFRFCDFGVDMNLGDGLQVRPRPRPRPLPRPLNRNLGTLAQKNRYRDDSVFSQLKTTEH